MIIDIPLELQTNHFGKLDTMQKNLICKHSALDLVLIENANELFRVLKPEGKLIMTIPFMFRLHHTYDFQRWTKYKISRELFSVGFRESTTVTELNNAFVLILDVIYQLVDHIKFLKLRAFIGITLIPMKILILDFLSIKLKSSDYLNSFSTHYGIIAIKPKDK